jgi:glycerate 2-kinase
MDPDRLLTQSLRQAPWGKTAARVLAAALDAADPARAVSAHLRRDGSLLTVGERTYGLDEIENVYLVGAGKAGAPMAAAAAAILGDRLTRGLVIVKEGHRLPPPPRLEILEAAHPLPDPRGADASHRLIRLLENTTPRDLVIVLISGGGSALLTAPAHGIPLEHLQQLTASLLACGADIQQINTLRKHLDTVKGGGLARFASPAQTLTLILSDVVGDPLDVIASGPTVPDPSTYEQAWEILTRYRLESSTPAPILERLQQGRQGGIEETPKPGDPLFEHVHNLLVGSNRQAAQAAVSQAQSEGLRTLLLTTSLTGEARTAGRTLAALAQQVHRAPGRALQPPLCLVCGGETTVTLHGDGLGGRNQELALAAVRGLAGLENTALVALATDGGDGPTNAAGAVATGDSLARAGALGLIPEDNLARSDSYHFFEPLGDLLTPGPTLTNVNDLTFLFFFGERESRGNSHLLPGRIPH